MEVWDTVYFDNTVKQWAFAAATVLAISAACLVLIVWARSHRKKAQDHERPLKRMPAEVLERTRWLLPAGLSLIVATRWLEMPETVFALLQGAGVVALGLQGGIYVARVVDYLLQREAAKRQAQDQAMSSFGVLRFLGLVVVWSVVLVVVLANLGVNVTGLVASLGVGGIAVALAAQNVLSDLFASLSIVLDRPFEVGDFIVVGSELGVVERIGLKTTRVKSLSGEQLVFSNGDLLSSRIRNFKRMAERRVVFQFGVLYGSPTPQLRKVPEIVRGIVEALEDVRFDRAHFAKFGDSSLDFEIVYYVLSADYTKYMDVQQEINLRLVESLAELGLDFAFPTRTLHVETVPQGLFAGDSIDDPSESSPRPKAVHN